MDDRRSRGAASVLALATAISVWLSLGTIAVTGGDAHRIAVLPSYTVLAVLVGVALAAALLSKLRLPQA
ncbi:MAG TPA: hypothetical protein VEA16_00780, partial [Vicinamibacterales bacterium]|nr:hypothetical protein [Vicinamibacterales bacterium]